MEIKSFTYETGPTTIRILICELTSNTEHLTPDEFKELNQISNLQRKKEYISVRRLLRETGLQDHISYAGRKPYFINSKYQISISHSKTHAAIALCDKACGLDMEIISDRVLRIRDKFQTDYEKQISGEDKFLNNLIWSAKECLYKLNNGLKDFRQDMQVLSIDQKINCIKIKTPEKIIPVHFQIYDDMIVCWCF